MSTVFTKAGHWDNDAGVVYGGYIERDEVAKIRDILVTKSLRFVKVPSNLNLHDAIGWVNSRCKPDDVALDIHLNANNNTNIHGTEVYYYKGVELASKLSATIASTIGTTNRSAKPDGMSYVGELGWCRQLKCKSFVVECLYLTSPEDRQKLNHAKIAEGIASYFVPTTAELKTQVRTLQQRVVALLKKLVVLLQGKLK